MILSAYCVTSVTFDSQIVTPMAETTVSIATPIGSIAATKVPNTIPKIIKESGPEINSALIKSSWILVSKTTSIAMPPVRHELNSLSTSMLSQLSENSCLASLRSKYIVTIFLAQNPSSS